MGLGRRHGHPARRRDGPQARLPVRHPGRPGPSRRPDGGPDPVPRPRPAGGERPPADRVPEQGPPDRGPLGLLQELLLHRPMVPEARRLRGGQGLELPRLSSELGVLRRLRRFHRPHHRPARIRRRVFRQGRRHADRRVGRHGHDHLPPVHGPRLRLDDRPPLPQDRARFRGRPGGDPARVQGDARTSSDSRPTRSGCPTSR